MSSCQLLPQAKSSLQHITDHINSNGLECNERPLIVGLSGLPGIGKTTLSHTLGYILEQEHELPTMTLCLDKTSAEHSLVELMETLEEWIRTKEYSVIFVEGALMGYRAIPSTHRVWSQLLERQLTPNDDSYHTLVKFNETLASLETHLYPLIDTFIQLSANHLDEWRSVLGNQSTVHQLYLERLDNYGFFDEGSLSSSSPVRKTTRRHGSDHSEVARHLVLYLDQDRKLVRSRRIVDGLSPPQEEDQNRNGIIQRSSALASTVKRITATSGRDRRRTWMSSALIRQQRKYIIETLNPRVLISFAMMSLLGLLGYSRRLSFILDLFNKIHHFVF
ncbi:hypothetical protein [Absidia glauca]|uniref:Uncharacterized protein n=1 Tax=Absidia glauca TaxID=4829 RepID=A0A163MWG9_ABSGL|nr:hypothetical protein [Absidia glauca]